MRFDSDVLSNFDNRVKAFAGLALGTSWRDTLSGKERRVRRVEIESEHGAEYISMKYDNGSESAENLYSEVKAGNYEPLSPNSDHARSFVTEVEGREMSR